ncbi:MAG: CDP-2,3-bis-(O-geranylgeranyl)-sn-glycerol synthase [Thermoplasmata archaeon]
MDLPAMVGGALLLIGQSFWIMFPAYVSGSAAVLFKGKRPMDFGASWRGNRVLGDGKTWEGFIFGGLTGVFAGTMQQLVSALSGQSHLVAFGYAYAGSFDPVLRPAMSPGSLAIIASLSYGGLVGDLLKSFIKRRMGLKRGSPSPFLMDQLDFVAGAWLVTLPIFWRWFLSVFTVYNFFIVLIMTPLLHRGVNIIGYKLGAKKEPW